MDAQKAPQSRPGSPAAPPRPLAGPADAESWVRPGRSGPLRLWWVGPDRVELDGHAGRWSARVVRSDWGGAALDLDGHFVSEAEALDWCRRMARVLEQDLRDGLEDDPTPPESASRGGRARGLRPY